MKLIKIRVVGYKMLKDTTVIFCNDNKLYEGNDVRFFIGLNGSGKSALIEAIGLIFSRILQDELPGFQFELEYSILVDKEEVFVNVQSSNKKMLVTTSSEGGTTKAYDSYKNVRHIHPDYIIAYSSGTNSIMNDIMGDLAKSALISDLYDICDDNNSLLDEKTRQSEKKRLLQQLDKLSNSPTCIFIDSLTSKFALAAFLSVNPQDANKVYFDMKRQLLKDIQESVQAISLSFTINANKLDNLKEDFRNLSKEDLTMLSLFCSEEEAAKIGILKLSDWYVYSGIIDTENSENNGKAVATLLFSNSEEGVMIDKLNQLFAF